MSTKIETLFSEIDFSDLSTKRKEMLDVLVGYVQDKKDLSQKINLNFICTHNSRRSQLAQFWAKVAAHKNHIAIGSFSGGIEVTACDFRTINALKKLGIKITSTKNSQNPIYQVQYMDNEPPLTLFSKLYNHKTNPTNSFAAIMTCSDAEEKCPIITGMEKRISLPFKDPKEYDGSLLEEEMYYKKSMEIAAEMGYVFSKIQ